MVPTPGGLHKRHPALSAPGPPGRGAGEVDVQYGVQRETPPPPGGWAAWAGRGPCSGRFSPCGHRGPNNSAKFRLGFGAETGRAPDAAAGGGGAAAARRGAAGGRSRPNRPPRGHRGPRRMAAEGAAGKRSGGAGAARRGRGCCRTGRPAARRGRADDSRRARPHKEQTAPRVRPRSWRRGPP